MRERKGFARRLSLARPALALVALAALPLAGARAQTPSPSPAGTTVDGEEMLYGNYEIVSSVEVGVRGVEIGGNRQKYYSDVNYRAGFRLFDSSLLARSRERAGTLFDTLLVTSSGFDADPHGRFRLNVEKDRFYKFDAQFRRNAYDNFISCCNFAQIRQVAPLAGTGLGSHRARVKHKIGDFDLKLLPQNRNFRANVGYAMSRWRGPGTSTLSYARDDFVLQTDPWRARSDEIRGGFESKIGKLDLNFTQGYRWYADDSTFVSGPNEGTALTPVATSAALNSYVRQQPTRGRAWYSRLSAHTQLDNRFDITGRYIYTNSRTRFDFIENITGRGNLENANVNIDLNRVTASSDDVERPSHLFDVGLTWTATRKLRVSDTFRYQTLNIEGVTEYTDLRLLRRIGAGAALPSPIVLTLNPSRGLDLRRWQNSLEADYDFGPRLSVFAGHRYIDRRLEIFKRQRVYPLNATTATGNLAEARAFADDERGENSTNGFFAGFKAKPTKNWSIYFDANRGTSDNAFTRIDYYDTVSTRVRSRWAIRRGLNLSVSFITRDNNNPGVTDEEILDIPEFDVDISSRVFTSALDWSSNERVYLNGGYTYQHVTSDIGIIFNPQAGLAGLGRAQYYLRDHHFFFNTSVRLHDRFSVYAGYSGHKDRGQGDRVTNDAAGLFIRSLPVRFQTPEVRAVLRLNRSLDLTAGYQYWDYKEDLLGRFPDLYINQDYRAHLPYASLRFYFGRRE